MISPQLASLLTMAGMMLMMFLVFHIIIPLTVPGARDFLLSTGPKKKKHQKN